MECGRRPQHYIYLLDGGGVRFVGVGKQGREAPWLTVWRFRHQLSPDCPLATWLVSLGNEPPTEHTLLGMGAPLHWSTARDAARLISGWFDNCLTEDRVNVGGRGRRIGRVAADGSLTIYPTIAAAAAALHTTRFGIHKALRVGRLFDAGPNRGRQRR